MKNALIEFLHFGLKQARACVFAGSFFVLLFLSHYVTFGIPRYDFIFLGALLIQAILVWAKIETVDEVKVIAFFHVIGFALEVFKTHPSIASWSYPEFGYFKLFNVPLYSGFMYAAVGSYIAQAWRIFDLRLRNVPPYWIPVTLSILIYLNFFTHHFIPDFRYFLMILVILVFLRTWVEYTPWKQVRRMPLVLGFFLIAFFIWIAENIATFLGAWKYPDQLFTWTTVSLHKIGSWSLLVIISFMIIAYLKHVKRHILHKS
jgi:uncharacterized membrane protein YoaT (DUF817 family)